MKRLVKKGQNFQVLSSNCNCHNYKPGKLYTALKDDVGYGIMGKDEQTGWVGNSIQASDYSVVPLNREEIALEMDALKKGFEKDLKRYQDMLDFLDKTGTEVFEDMKFRCYTAITSLNSNATDLEKAEVIAGLIENR